MNETLINSNVINVLCERFSEYECSKDFDLDNLKHYALYFCIKYIEKNKKYVI